ncbi:MULTISPECIES: DUF5719 family protein [Janibacter]|uniref:DUF5719 family protein n=1 Tax=Janibacter TaxID=53457 RepID=UPI000836608F|nr:DUF5719 family protein [Janibacter terrae]HBO53812.1 hypothetical protein [Janibacter terrae]
MSPRPARSAWLPAAARVVVVGAAATGVVLGADRLGAVAPQASPPVGAPSIATSLTSTYCPGDPFAGVEGAPDVDLTGGVVAHAAPAQVLDGVITPPGEPGTITVEDLRGEPAPTPDAEPRSGPTSESTRDLGSRPVRVRATQERAPGLVATEGFVASGESVQGLAAQPCGTATADAWLVGGGGDKGRQERLVLTNPGANPVTTRIEPVGAKGEDRGRSVVVPAHGRSVVLLDAVGGTDAPQAVHVSATDGLVVPTLVDHHTDGLTPAGVELVGPTAAPARRLVVPGNANGARRGIVLAAPGDQDAVVEVRAVGEERARSAGVRTIPAGRAVDVALPESPGVHSWVVESDEPVVAAAHVSTEDSGGRRDMAWSVATPAIGTLGGAALPTSPSSDVRRFVEVTADEEAATADLLVLRDGEITTREVDLEAGRSKALSIGRASAVWVRPTDGRVHAAVLLIGREQGARAETTSIPVLPSRVTVRDVPVVQAR